MGLSCRLGGRHSRIRREATQANSRTYILAVWTKEVLALGGEKDVTSPLQVRAVHDVLVAVCTASTAWYVELLGKGWRASLFVSLLGITTVYIMDHFLRSFG